MYGRASLRSSVGVAVCLLWGGVAVRAAVAEGTPSRTSDYPDLRAKIQKSPKLTIEKVCTPIRSVQGPKIKLFPNRDGKTYDVALMYYPDYAGPYTTVIVDLGAKRPKPRAESLPSPLLQMGAIRSGCLAPNGKYYRATAGKKMDIGFYVYDPATEVISRLEAEIAMGGPARSLTIGSDGMLYGAASEAGRAGVYQLDPNTGKLTDYGLIGPSHAPNDCWAYSLAADDRYVYVASGKIPWYLIAFDRKAKQAKVIMTVDKVKWSVHLRQLRHGCDALVQFPRRKDGKVRDYYWLHQGQAILKQDLKEPPPWDEPANPKPWVPRPPEPELWVGEAIPRSGAPAALWYRLPEDKAKAPADPPSGAKPADLGWKAVNFQVPIYSVAIHRVFTLPDGRVFGAGGDYIGYFRYDPETGKCLQLPPAAVNPYCMAHLDGKLYMSGYPSSALYEYDLARPWTTGRPGKPWERTRTKERARANPRRLTYLSTDGSGCHKMMSATVAGGKVFFGGRWYRDGIGGGLGWWDPKTGKPGGISVPFRSFQVHYLASTPDGKSVVVSCYAVWDQIEGKPAPDTAKLFVFDTADMRIVREIEPVKGAEWTGPIAAVGGTRVMGLTYDPADRHPSRKRGKFALSYGQADASSLLYLVDVTSGRVLWCKKIPYPAGFRMNENMVHRDGFSFQRGPDGKVWTFTGGKFTPVNPEKDWWHSYLGEDLSLVRIDPRDGAIEVVGRIDQGGEIAFSDRDLYLSGGGKYLTGRNIHLRRISNVVPVPQTGARPEQ